MKNSFFPLKRPKLFKGKVYIKKLSGDLLEFNLTAYDVIVSPSGVTIFNKKDKGCLFMHGVNISYIEWTK